MSDVAKAAGVSTMTVSRAFRHDGSVAEKRRIEILRIANEMGYVVDRNASELRSKRSGFVAVTVPSLNNPNFADSVRGLTAGLAEHGLQVLLGYTNYNLTEEQTLIQQLKRRNPEAIVVTGSTHTDATRRSLESANIPVVQFWDHPANPIGASVGFSNAMGGAMIADHFMDRGYRNLAFIGGDTSFDTRGKDRRVGFVRRLTECGLETFRLIDVGKPPIAIESGVIGARTLIDRFPETDAVMCVSDSVAFGAMTEFQRMGKRIPDDIAVAGFGAFDVSAFSIPPITTIRPHAYDIGAKTARLIGRLLGNGAVVGSQDHVEVEPDLVIRSSS